MDNSFIHPLSCRDYHKMEEAGIFSFGARLELIDGVIYDMAPLGNEHNEIVDVLNEILVTALHGQARVRVQGSIVLDRGTKGGEPEPDLVLLKPQSYRDSSATTDDVLLLIEVSDTTLAKDRNIKLPFYARHGIPEVWLFNIPEQRIETYSKPIKGEYTEIRTALKGCVLTPICLPDIPLDLKIIF